MTNTKPVHIKTISEFHRTRGLPPPQHPLISVVDYALVTHPAESTAMVFDYYSISIKRGVGKMFYGQQEYDFDEGVMYFMAPHQILRVDMEQRKTAIKPSGWILLIHPDFLWNTSLVAQIKKYEYFNYEVNEALFLSDKEEAILDGIIRNIEHEYQSNIDSFSQGIIVSQIETLLNYADRFYRRQFITRKKSSHDILNRLEKILSDHFKQSGIAMPTVQHISEALNMSPGYLSGVLKSLTGQSTQQHIHDKLIEKAKEKLSTTALSVSEIAFDLGFEHSQSFSKLFKAKTNLSPLAFRASFN